jgi:hypothetical protein
MINVNLCKWLFLQNGCFMAEEYKNLKNLCLQERI